MRKLLAGIAIVGLLAACAEENPVVSTASPSPGATAADCAKGVTTYVSPGTLTVGTDNPAYPPYFQGGAAKESEWKLNDPATGKGFESAVAYAVSGSMGFSPDNVQWVVAPFNQTYAPGAKSWDFAIEQISYSTKRASAVDFSESYFDVNQALVAVKGTPITSATSLADLQGYTLAAPTGTTSYEYIVGVIKPTKEPGAFSTLSDTVAAINAHQVDGIVVDLPTALYIADPFVQEVKNSVVVGQFPTVGTPEHFGMTFVKGNPLVGCVNQALAELKSDGTLQAITTKWLSEKTNVGSVPVFSTS
ncbi:MAG TPA: ABC transporter substrate-binding protein [Actinomycetota bacterium]|nr:ABC transporter substrate-binding protein [Actinomycetota bacterium]